MKRYTFKPEDFEGAGQYLVRVHPTHKKNRNGKPHVIDTGYLSTIMYKVGYINNIEKIGNGKQLTCLVSMADGWIRFCHYITKDAQGNEIEDSSIWKVVYWQGRLDSDPVTKRDSFIDYLNKEDHEYRFASQEEVIRVILSQSHRCKG